MELPTVEECREFVATLNRGRAALDPPLDPIEYLDYDDCDPAVGTNCLSAHHLFTHADIYVGSSTVGVHDSALESRLVEALETTLRGGELVLPRAIRAVTDPFDRIEYDHDEELRTALRARLVEAGCVAS